MTPLSINGRFHAALPTGVQRVARELVSRLVARTDGVLHLPAGCAAPPAMKGRWDVVRGRLRGVPWEQLELPLRRSREWGLLPLEPANAGPVIGRPGVLILHDVLPLTHPDLYAPAFRRWFALGPARAARQALRVVTFTAWSRDRIVETLGLDPERVRVVPQGVEPFHRPLPPERVQDVLRRLGLEPGFVLALGGGDPRKDGGFAERLVAAWPGGVAHAPRVVVVGEARHWVLRPDAPTSPSAGPSGVRRLGRVSDHELHALYTAASVLCFPSRAEGFGRPPLEAMGCGTPVVVGDYGCAREVLGDAAVVLPLDAGAWAGALSRLLADPLEGRARAEAGRARAARFRWDRAVDALLEACASVAWAPSLPARTVRRLEAVR